MSFKIGDRWVGKVYYKYRAYVLSAKTKKEADEWENKMRSVFKRIEKQKIEDSKVVYFMRYEVEDKIYVKVGMSCKPKYRRKKFKDDISPKAIDLNADYTSRQTIGCIDSNLATMIEMAAKAYLSPYNLNGEWFCGHKEKSNLEASINQFIAVSEFIAMGYERIKPKLLFEGEHNDDNKKTA